LKDLLDIGGSNLQQKHQEQSVLQESAQKAIKENSFTPTLGFMKIK